MAINIVLDEKVEVKVGTESYMVTIPSLKKFSELDKELKKLNADEVPEFYQKYFEQLGLPSSVTERFSLKNWTMLIEELTGVKKK